MHATNTNMDILSTTSGGGGGHNTNSVPDFVSVSSSRVHQPNPLSSPTTSSPSDHPKSISLSPSTSASTITPSSHHPNSRSPSCCETVLRNALLTLILVPVSILLCYYVALFVSANAVISHDSSLPTYAVTSLRLFQGPDHPKSSFAALFTINNPSTILPFRLDSSAALVLSYRGAEIGAGAVNGPVRVDAESSEMVVAGGKLVHDVEKVVAATDQDHGVELGVGFNVTSRVGNRMLKFEEMFSVACNVTVDKLISDSSRVLASSCNTHHLI